MRGSIEYKLKIIDEAKRTSNRKTGRENKLCESGSGSFKLGEGFEGDFSMIVNLQTSQMFVSSSSQPPVSGPYADQFA